jgi:lipoprotein-releasing system ATP-binding protein
MVLAKRNAFLDDQIDIDTDMTKKNSDTPISSPKTYLSHDDDFDIDGDDADIVLAEVYGTAHISIPDPNDFIASRKKSGELLVMVKDLMKEYRQGDGKLNILNGVDLRMYSGEICALVGPSGSGKSTLLHILGLLDSPTSGQIIMGDKDISKLNDAARTKLRNGHIGFVYQFHHLLPEFNAIENVSLPLIIAGKSPKDASDKAADLLEQLGLGHRLRHRPATLSGGEQQRVAIARALVNDPYLLFADEPTGNLDPETAEEVFQILLAQVRGRGIGALVATHNMELANDMDRILEMKGGRIIPY